MATRAASPDRVFAIFCDVSRCHAVTLSRCHAICMFLTRGGLPYERAGGAHRKFWIKPDKKTNLGVASLLLTPQIDKFQHNWLKKRSMSFCLKTEMGEGLFCLLCKKHDTSNPQNKSKFLTRSPVNDFAQKSLKITAVRHSIWTQFQRRCYRECPCFREPLTKTINSKDALLDYRNVSFSRSQKWYFYNKVNPRFW